MAATMVTATVHCTPRKAWRASTTGCKRHAGHVILQCLCETLEALGVFVHRSDVCLKDALLSRCVTDHLGEPPEMGRAPVRPARRADIVSEQEELEERNWASLRSAGGIFTGSCEVTHGFIFHFGDIDRGEVS